MADGAILRPFSSTRLRAGPNPRRLTKDLPLPGLFDVRPISGVTCGWLSDFSSVAWPEFVLTTRHGCTKDEQRETFQYSRTRATQPAALDRSKQPNGCGCPDEASLREWIEVEVLVREYLRGGEQQVFIREPLPLGSGVRFRLGDERLEYRVVPDRIKMRPDAQAYGT